MYLFFFPLLTLEKHLRNENLKVAFENIDHQKPTTFKKGHFWFNCCISIYFSYFVSPKFENQYLIGSRHINVEYLFVWVLEIMYIQVWDFKR